MLLIFLIVAFLIAYGSIFPFDFSAISLEPGAFEAFLKSWRLTSRGDILGNVALFAPFGFFGMVGLAPDRPPAVRVALVALSGLALAVIVQIAQLFLPLRDAEMSDVAWNMLGLGFGLVCAAAAGRQLLAGHEDARGAWQSPPALLLGLWIAAELIPFVPSLDLQAMKDSLKPLLLAPVVDPVEIFRIAASWLAVFYLIARALPRRAGMLTPAAVAGMLFLKILIVHVALDLADVVGAAVALAVWWGGFRRIPRRALAAATLVGVSVLISGLAPFEPRAVPANFHWLPFEASLSGLMALNASIICGKLFLYGAIVYLLRCDGTAWKHAAAAAAGLTLAVEIAQIFLAGHTPEITDPLLALLCALGLWQIEVAGRRTPDEAAADAGPLAPQLPSATGFGAWAAPRAVRLIVGVAAISLVISTVLGLPGIPYNVRELFRGGGSASDLILFSLALLWIGASAALIGHLTARSRHPWLALPGWTILACVVSYLLMLGSVTEESLADVTGSANTAWFAIYRHKWGDFGVWLVNFVPPLIYQATEKTIRYVTLYISPILLMVVMHAAAEATAGANGREKWRRMAEKGLLFFVFALPWLVIAKYVTFDFSSTDNLNELIARPTAHGIGGGGYLYLLVLLGTANAVLLARASLGLRIDRLILAVVFTAAAVPAGWFLLNIGLVQGFRKYEDVYSGVDFLLGPDRRTKLPTEVLMMRWSVVYVAIVLLVAYGSRIVLPFKAPPARTRAAPPESVARPEESAAEA